jgi:hypothetical protein
VSSKNELPCGNARTASSSERRRSNGPRARTSTAARRSRAGGAGAPPGGRAPVADEALVDHALRAIARLGRPEPRPHGVLRGIAQRALAPEAHRRRLVDQRGQHQHRLLEIHARLQGADARRRRPVDAPRIVAFGVTAQPVEDVAVPRPRPARHRAAAVHAARAAHDRGAQRVHGAGTLATISASTASPSPPSLASG